MVMVSEVAKKFAILCFSVLVVLAPIMDSYGYINIAANIFLLAAAMIMLSSVTSERRGGIDLMLCFFFLFIIALPAKIQISAGYFPWSANLALQDISLAYGVISLSLLFYMAGFSFAARSNFSQRYNLGRSSQMDAAFYTKWASLIAVTSFLFAIAAGPSAWFVARIGEERALFEGITQQLLFVARSLSLLAIIMMLYLGLYAGSKVLRRYNKAVLVFFAVPFVIINFPPALPRFLLFGVLIAISCPWIEYRQPKIKAVIIPVAILLLFVVFPITKSIGREDYESFLNLFGTIDAQTYLLNVDFDAFMQVVSTIEYLLGGGDLRWGNNFLGVLLFFVPRSIWPGKPLDTGEIVSVSQGYLYNNVSNPLPSEALIAFGIIGPAIVFFLLAIAIYRIENVAGKLVVGCANIHYHFLYAISMGFIVIILRGSINGIAPQISSAFLAFFLMQYFRKKRIIWRQAS